MSVRRLAEAHLQPALTADNLAWAKTQIAKYPEGRQASAGHMLADVSTGFGSLDIVFGEVDR
jgi:hypothetical protein